MPTNQPSNFELVQMLEPWFPLFARVGAAALRDHLAAVPTMGMPRRTERANDFHRTWRENFRRVCTLADPLLSLIEEPEGKGLDCLLCRMNPDVPFTMRWGRYDGITIQRNMTGRTREVFEQGTLFGCAFDDGIRELPNVTLGFTIEDDFTEIGIPQWWFGQLVLLRERFEESEYITQVHVYEKPNHNADQDGGWLPSPIVSARESEIAEWSQLVQDIRGQSA